MSEHYGPLKIGSEFIRAMNTSDVSGAKQCVASSSWKSFESSVVQLFYQVIKKKLTCEIDSVVVGQYRAAVRFEISRANRKLSKSYFLMVLHDGDWKIETVVRSEQHAMLFAQGDLPPQIDVHQLPPSSTAEAFFQNLYEYNERHMLFQVLWP